MAIASLVCFFFLFFLLGIVFGHISLSQIKRNREEGRGLAIAGLVISYVITVMTIVAVVVSAVLMVWMGRMLEEESDPAASASTAGLPCPNGTELPAFIAPADLGANCACDTDAGQQTGDSPRSGRCRRRPPPSMRPSSPTTARSA